MHNKNLILDTDSYKVSMYQQYPEGTSNVYSYVESRGGEYPYTVFFGLQPLIKNLEENRITMQNVLEAAVFFKKHGLEFNLEGWAYIARDLGGKLPLRIKAVAEGSVLPNGTVLMTVENTDPKCFWLTTWLETYLLRLWYPTTVATQSHAIKKLIKDNLIQSSDDPEGEISFKLHDFGSRGVSSPDSAALGGAAHLVNFMGSDTVLGVDLANRVYKHDMAGFSIPAAEHSTITSWGVTGEEGAYDNMLNKFAKPGALLAVVSDSYDIEHAILNIWGKKLRDKVVESGATVVIRPDSGHPPTMVLECLQNLSRGFGSIVNSKGYKVLNHVRVIQGDGINMQSIKEILDLAHMAGYSATNIAFGMGGALLQQVNRDTQKFAYKCSSIRVNGEERDVFKCPKDAPFKRSKAGRFDSDTRLVTVFENGVVTKEYTFEEVRAKSKDLTAIEG